MKGWKAAHAKWKSLGTKGIDLWTAPRQRHSFFNKDPWQTLTLIGADHFLVKHGLLTGEPTIAVPASGGKLVPAPWRLRLRAAPERTVAANGTDVT